MAFRASGQKEQKSLKFLWAQHKKYCHCYHLLTSEKTLAPHRPCAGMSADLWAAGHKGPTLLSTRARHPTAFLSTYLGTMTSRVMRYSESSTKSSLLTISLSVRVKRFPLEGGGTMDKTIRERLTDPTCLIASRQTAGNGAGSREILSLVCQSQVQPNRK